MEASNSVDIFPIARITRGTILRQKNQRSSSQRRLKFNLFSFSAVAIVRLCDRMGTVLGWTAERPGFEPGAQPRLKIWGGPRFGSQHRGACAPRPARGRAGGGCGSPRCFLKTQMLNPAFWWLLRSLLGSWGRAYPSKQQGLNQFQNFKFSAVVATLVVRTKNQSNGNYETYKLHATRHLCP